MEKANLIEMEAQNPVLAAEEVLRDTSVLYSPEALRSIISRLLEHIKVDCGNAITKVAEQLTRHSEAMANIAPLLGDAAYHKIDGEITEIPDLDGVFIAVVGLKTERDNFAAGLKFYADKEHMVGFDNEKLGFDSVTGEPQNWLMPCVDDDVTFKELCELTAGLMIEDGGIARGVLDGLVIVNNGDGFIIPEGEGEFKLTASPPHSKE